MRKLITIFLMLLLIFSCKKEIVMKPITYSDIPLRKSNIEIRFNDGSKKIFVMSNYVNIKFDNGTLIFIPDINCAISVQSCKTQFSNTVGYSELGITYFKPCQKL